MRETELIACWYSFLSWQYSKTNGTAPQEEVRSLLTTQELNDVIGHFVYKKYITCDGGGGCGVSSSSSDVVVVV